MSAKSALLVSLGEAGPKVPALGFGLMGMSFGVYGTIQNDEERFKVLDRAVELGDTFWDTSDLYGDSEELLNKWFKRTGKREKIFLATKFGFIKGADAFNFTIDSSAKYVREACEKSLTVLGTDYIDLYYVHRANPDTPIEETMRGLAELQAEGKIKHIGLSEVTSATIHRAHKVAPVAAVQIEYSPFVLEVEGSAGTNVLATCRELGIAVVAYSPLGRGLLTTTFSDNALVNDASDWREGVFPRFKQENRDTNVKLVNQFKVFADKKGCTPSQLSLAWLIKQGAIPIPGTKKIQYLEQNWGSLKFPLTDEGSEEIRTWAQKAEIAGGRNPEKLTQMTLVDTVEES